MAYSQGDKIEAIQYNSFVNDVNEVYADENSGATGEASGGFGYGQPPLSLVNVDDKITAAQWTALLGVIHECGNHQGVTPNTPSSVSVSDEIIVLPLLATDVQSIRDNKFNIASGVGSVTSASTESASGNWDSTRTQTITASFNSWDEMRYFFNAQGKIRFSFSFDGTPDNTTESNWVAMAGAIETVSFGYTSTSSSGGVGVSGGGFYDLTTSDQQIYSYVPSGYSSEQYLIEARLNAAPGSATDVIFTVSFVTPGGGDVIDLTLNSELALFDPSDILSVNVPTLTPGSIS